MRKKIMVAEQSDAIRSIAETILHQNGYDVLTASTIEKAKELIIAGKPNMVIIGADLKDAEGNYLYDSLDENDLTSSIPILIIADPGGRSARPDPARACSYFRASASTGTVTPLQRSDRPVFSSHVPSNRLPRTDVDSISNGN